MRKLRERERERGRERERKRGIYIKIKLKDIEKGQREVYAKTTTARIIKTDWLVETNYAYKQTDGYTDGQRDRWTYRQTDRRRDRQTYRQTVRPADRWVNRQAN